MVESPEQILFVLDTCGEDIELDLAGVTIKAIPGHLVYNIQNFDSVYDLEKQDLNFQISSTDFYTNEIDKGEKFTYIVPNYTSKQYTFEIVSFIEDFIGWVELKVKLIGVEDV
jgi:hypothetical protein